MHPMITPEDIEAWRKTHGLTKKELAAQMGITYPFLVNILNGKRELSAATAQKFKELCGDAARVCRYDDVRAYAVRLTPTEFQQLCAVAGVQDMSAEDVEKMVRDLLQRTWDELAAAVPDVVEEPEAPVVMPAPSVMPGTYMPAARGDHGPQC